MKTFDREKIKELRAKQKKFLRATDYRYWEIPLSMIPELTPELFESAVDYKKVSATMKRKGLDNFDEYDGPSGEALFEGDMAVRACSAIRLEDGSHERGIWTIVYDENNKIYWKSESNPLSIGGPYSQIGVEFAAF